MPVYIIIRKGPQSNQAATQNSTNQTTAQTNESNSSRNSAPTIESVSVDYGPDQFLQQPKTELVGDERNDGIQTNSTAQNGDMSAVAYSSSMLHVMTSGEILSNSATSGGTINLSGSSNSLSFAGVKTEGVEENEGGAMGPRIDSVYSMGMSDMDYVNNEKYKKHVESARELLILGMLTPDIYCELVIKHRMRYNAIDCNVCFASISSDVVLDHARDHMEHRRYFPCNYCQREFASRASATAHFEIVHLTNPPDWDAAQGQWKELAEEIDRCFGDSDDSCPDQSLSIQDYVQRAVGHHPNQTPIVPCFVCKKNVVICDQQNRPQLQNALHHVLLHLGKEIYHCGFCSFRSSDKQEAVKHTKLTHDHQYHRDANVLTNYEEYEREIKAIADHCFGRPLGIEKSLFELPAELLERVYNPAKKRGRGRPPVHSKTSTTNKTTIGSATKWKSTHGQSSLMSGWTKVSKTESGDEMDEDGDMEIDLDMNSGMSKEPPENHHVYLNAARELFLQRKISLNKYCSQLIKYRIYDQEYIQCNICKQQLPTRYKSTRSIRLSRMSDHARKHLNREDFTCTQCHEKFVTHVAIVSHFKKVHQSGPPTSDLNAQAMEASLVELVDMLERCFGRETSDEPLHDLSIVDFCDRALFTLSQCGRATIECEACGESMAIANRKNQMVIEHIFTHLKRDIFRCRLCDHRACTMATIRKHTKTVHGQKTGRNAIAKNMDEFGDEIKAVFNYCYGSLDGSDCKPFDLPPDILERLQAAKRGIVNKRCATLIAQYGKDDDRIVCLLCSKSMQCRSKLNKGINRFAIDHATDHMATPIYQCMECELWKTGLQSTIMHVRNAHGGSAVGRYVDISHRYTDQILVWLDKCYDEKMENREEAIVKRAQNDTVSKFGLEESDDEVEVAPSRHQTVARRASSTMYNLRPRRRAKRSWRFSPDREVQQEEAAEEAKRIRLEEIEGDRQVRVRLTYVREKKYECTECSMKSKNRLLMEQHIRLMHLG